MKALKKIKRKAKKQLKKLSEETTKKSKSFLAKAGENFVQNIQDMKNDSYPERRQTKVKGLSSKEKIDKQKQIEFMQNPHVDGVLTIEDIFGGK